MIVSRPVALALLSIVIILIGTSIFAQNTPEEPTETQPLLILSLFDESCDLIPAETISTAQPETTPEATAEANPPETTATPEAILPVLTLAPDCTLLLRVPENDTLWLSLTLPDSRDWPMFEIVEDDPFPPQLDRRGRYVGCRNPQQGDQTCYVLWTDQDTSYRIEIPLIVGAAYIAPAAQSGGWQGCGSCDTCGAPANQCVTAPDGRCLHDPGNCGSGGGSNQSAPVSTAAPGNSVTATPATPEIGTTEDPGPTSAP